AYRDDMSKGSVSRLFVSVVSGSTIPFLISILSVHDLERSTADRISKRSGGAKSVLSVEESCVLG
ncbi:MAG: hypothetical protein JW701_05980, partial [Kosmotogaceae bacterium]|nr:hypothetical protein [Kosmotogaceae bacterium]